MTRSEGPHNEMTALEAVVFITVTQIITICGFFIIGAVSGYSALSFVPLVILFFIGLVCWIARGLVRQTPSDNGTIMVRYGHPIGHNVQATYYVSVAVASGSFLSIVALWLLVPQQVSTGVSIINLAQLVLSGFEGLLLIPTIRTGWTAYREIINSRTEYRKSIHYDPLKFAAIGQVYLGCELRRETILPVHTFSEKGSDRVLPGEVVGRHIVCLVGEDGPYIIDLGNGNPHVLITSISTGGKSQTLRALILRHYYAKKISTLLFDWNGEHPEFFRRMGGHVWRVPENFKINPLRLLDFSPAERIAELEESLTFTLHLSSLQSAEVGKVADEAYKQHGILEEDPSTWNRKPPEWSDLIAILEARVHHGYYKGQQLESINWAIRKLHRAVRVFGDEPANFFDIIMKVPVCIDLSVLKGADAAKALVTYTLLQRIYHAFDARGFSDLRLLIVLEEAHLMVSQKDEERAGVTQEPLPVRLTRMGRKYGFALIFATQVPTIDLPEAIIANVGTIIALPHESPMEVNYIKRWMNLSQTELEIYRRLPSGGCFIKRIGQPYPSLVKIQMVSDREIKMARMRNIIQPVTLLQFTGLEETSQLTEAPATDQIAETAEEKLLRLLDLRKSKLPELTAPRSASADVREIKAGPELTLQENRIFNILLSSPTTMKKLQAGLVELTYRQMLQILQHLEDLGLIQVARVPNLRAEWTVYYGAMKATWLQSESLAHRAMIEMIVEALLPLRPVQYMQTQRLGGDIPDVSLEEAKPKTAIEVETGRKKMTPDEIMKWAMRVRERNQGLGYERTIVVVPNLAVRNHYSDPCSKQGLELVTMGRLLSYLHLTPSTVTQHSDGA